MVPTVSLVHHAFEVRHVRFVRMDGITADSGDRPHHFRRRQAAAIGRRTWESIKGFKKTVHEADAIDVTPVEQSQQAQGVSANAAAAQPEAAPSSAPKAAQPGHVKQG